MNRIKGSSSTTQNLEEEITPFKGKSDLIKDYEKLLSNKRRIATASLLTAFGALFMVAGSLTDHQENKQIVPETQKQIQTITTSTRFRAISGLAYITALPIWGMVIYSNRKTIKNLKNRERDA